MTDRRGQVWEATWTNLGQYYLVVAPFSHASGPAWLCLNLDGGYDVRIFDSPWLSLFYRRVA